jgi:hypothetical protein
VGGETGYSFQITSTASSYAFSDHFPMILFNRWFSSSTIKDLLFTMMPIEHFTTCFFIGLPFHLLAELLHHNLLHVVQKRKVEEERKREY